MAQSSMRQRATISASALTSSHSVHVQITNSAPGPRTVQENSYPPVRINRADPKQSPDVEEMTTKDPPQDAKPKRSQLAKNVKRFLGSLSLRRVRQASDDVETPSLTPDGSCSSSPSSSRDDLTVSSVEDLGLQLLKCQTLTTPLVYLLHMLKSREGYPMWEPRPQPQGRSPLDRGKSLVPSERAFAPGDITIYSLERAIKKCFNIWEEEAALRDTAISLGYAALQLPSRETRTTTHFTKDSIVTEGADVKNRYNGSDRSEVDAFEFRRNSPSGAFLVVTSTADLEELEDYNRLREWVILHPELIYAHANSKHKIAHDEDLYIATGAIKCNSWANAAFREYTGGDNPICLEDRARVGDDRPRYAWDGAWSSSQARVGRSEHKELKDQTLFLRGFKLGFSKAFRHRMDGPQHSTPNASSNVFGLVGRVEPVRPAEYQGGHGRNRGARELGGGGGHDSGARRPSSGSFDGSPDSSAGRLNHQNEGNTQYRSTYGQTSFAGGAVDIQTFPDSPRQACHPSDLINEYLLDATGADFALCHDDEWRFSAGELDDPNDFAEASIKGSHIEIRNGVAQLCKQNTGTEDSETQTQTSPYLRTAETDSRADNLVGEPEIATTSSTGNHDRVYPSAEAPSAILESSAHAEVLSDERSPHTTTTDGIRIPKRPNPFIMFSRAAQSYPFLQEGSSGAHVSSHKSIEAPSLHTPAHPRTTDPIPVPLQHDPTNIAIMSAPLGPSSTVSQQRGLPHWGHSSLPSSPGGYNRGVHPSQLRHTHVTDTISKLLHQEYRPSYTLPSPPPTGMQNHGPHMQNANHRDSHPYFVPDSQVFRGKDDELLIGISVLEISYSSLTTPGHDPQRQRANTLDQIVETIGRLESAIHPVETHASQTLEGATGNSGGGDGGLGGDTEEEVIIRWRRHVDEAMNGEEPTQGERNTEGGERIIEDGYGTTNGEERGLGGGNIGGRHLSERILREGYGTESGEVPCKGESEEGQRRGGGFCEEKEEEEEEGLVDGSSGYGNRLPQKKAVGGH